MVDRVGCGGKVGGFGNGGAANCRKAPCWGQKLLACKLKFLGGKFWEAVLGVICLVLVLYERVIKPQKAEEECPGQRPR